MGQGGSEAVAVALHHGRRHPAGGRGLGLVGGWLGPAPQCSCRAARAGRGLARSACPQPIPHRSPASPPPAHAPPTPTHLTTHPPTQPPTQECNFLGDAVGSCSPGERRPGLWEVPLWQAQEGDVLYGVSSERGFWGAGRGGADEGG